MNLRNYIGGVCLGVALVAGPLCWAEPEQPRAFLSGVEIGNPIALVQQPPDPAKGGAAPPVAPKAAPPAPQPPAPQPAAPQPGAQPQPVQPPQVRQDVAQAQSAAARQAASSQYARAAARMLGDPPGLSALAFTSPTRLINFPNVIAGEAPGAQVVPTVRNFKIADNQSPLPEDRIYFSFNYFDRVNESVNRRAGSPLDEIRAYRYTFGAEMTFLDGDASVGLRVPINSLDVESSLAGFSGDDTAVGDLTLFLKYVFWQNQFEDALSVGLAVTAPTGPDSFGGSPFIPPFHSTTLQPFVGYRFNWDRFFIQGFLALDVPTDSRDVTMWYTDIGFNYYLYRTEEPDRWLRAVVPAFEVHVNTPLNHRGAFNFNDPVGTPDFVGFTYGTTFVFESGSTLSLGLVTPVTGPKPFDYEILVQLNIKFGGEGAAGLLNRALR